MAIPVLALITNLCKPRPKYPQGQIHLKLAGMNQDIFIRQWGEPEIDTTLEKLKRLLSLDFLPFIRETFENDTTRVWIYEKMDMFVLFRKGNLVAHFRWSEFKEKFKEPTGGIDHTSRRSHSSIASTFSMLA